MKKQNENKSVLLSTFYFLFSRYRKGFTLVELIVAVGLFVSIVTIATGVFVRTLRTERQVSSLVSAESNVGLALEQMAREIRTGYDFCKPDASGTQTCGQSELAFTNAQGLAVDYRFANNSIERGVGGSFGAITGGNVTVSYLHFIVRGDQVGDGWSPRITVSAGVAPQESSVSSFIAHLQTTVSSRILDT